MEDVDVDRASDLVKNGVVKSVRAQLSRKTYHMDGWVDSDL